jgi:hypothetical protein
MVKFLDTVTGDPKPSGPSSMRINDSFSLREAIPFWFAISSPLTGIILGFLAAWVVALLTS